MKENQNSRILVLLHERIFILRVTLYKLLRKNSISCSHFQLVTFTVRYYHKKVSPLPTPRTRNLVSL